ncbi:hypothetical protein FOMA001_g2428 [Fusarium oxysporum f. sp. matthiolae]|nr:hypothetical protein FOMA001_g2428 [Fusarium oxysporum f. sp. matthiolae]
MPLPRLLTRACFMLIAAVHRKDRPLPSGSAARLDDNERREVTPYERIKQSMSVSDEPANENEFEKFINSPPRPMTTSTPLE